MPSPLIRVAELPYKDEPRSSRERQAFSFGVDQTIDNSGRADFQLALAADRAPALLQTLAHCRFHSWQATPVVEGEETILAISVDFRPRHGRAAISVLIPTYENSEDELRRSVASALASLDSGGFPQGSEVLVLDDASSVPAESRLGEFAHELHAGRLRIVANARNRGVPPTRNRAVAEARNPFAAFVDADDEVRPAYLGAMAHQLERGADVVATDMFLPLSGAFICARANGIPEVFHRNSFGSGIALNLASAKLRRLMKRQPLYNPLFALGSEDWELNCVLWQLGMEISVVPAPFYRYYARPTGRNFRTPRRQALAKRLLPWSAKLRAMIARL